MLLLAACVPARAGRGDADAARAALARAQLVDKALITSSAEPQRSTVETRAEHNAMTEEEIDAALNDDELDLEVMGKKCARRFCSLKPRTFAAQYFPECNHNMV